MPLERLTSPEQHFRCEPFSATMRAASCLARQQSIVALAAGEVWFDHHGNERQRGRGPGRYQTSQRAAVGQHKAVRCADCELGRRVLAKLESVADTEVPPSTLRSVGVPKVEG